MYRSSNNSEPGCLILIFGRVISFFISKTIPKEGFTQDDDFFKDIGHGDWNGFYDWLRDKDGKLVGIRYSPFKEASWRLGGQFPSCGKIAVCRPEMNGLGPSFSKAS
jgi:hypothetical protein